MASIFKNSLIKERLEKFEIPNLEEKIEIVKRWHNDYHNGTLKQDKETSREQAYNQDFFIKILGYMEKPENPHSIEPKSTTEKGQIPDVILGNFSIEGKNLSAVVELKGANIPLNKPQKREGNMSPVQQAFKYKTQYPKCPFVIASNFYEFRLFQDNQLDYEMWTLDDLIDENDNYYNFRKFYYLLNKENFTSTEGNSTTQNLLTDIRIEQEEITKTFYKEYRELRLELLRNIYQKNRVVRDMIDLGIEKAQKLIDRIVFVCFCEDKSLLPDNSLARVLKYSENNFGSLWNTLKGFFEGIDKGSEKLEIPDGYNGGLFKKDDELDSLIIDDSVLKNLMRIGEYNFNEDLSVTVLGHIFEQSISDLEEIKKKVNNDNELKNITISKRKKDGIFYTPDYIVDYIVQNSLGKYLLDKEEELKLKHKLREDILDKNYDKREQLAYQEYQVFLENIKILDPACGSGAFLVKVFDYLLEENKRIGQILGGGLFDNEQTYKQILKKNIFGVDLNPESVEITRLSLWLKTAQKNKKLTSLDENIKCGNSLIDNPDVAGNKAFNWDKEFPEIMRQGGFDVIVGNPPYIKEYTSREAFDGLHESPYYEGKMDLWQFFACFGLDLLKENGYLSYIAPNSWLTNAGAKKTRNKILRDSRITDFIDFGDYNVFSEAGIQTMIFVLKKTKISNGKISYLKLSKKDDVQNSLNQKALIDFNQSEFIDKPITFIENKQDDVLLDKVLSKKNFELSEKEIANGIHPHYDSVNKKISIKHNGKFEIGQGIFSLSNLERNSLKLSDKEDELIKNYYNDGSDSSRYFINKNNKLWLIYTDSKFKNPKEIEPYPNIKAHLDRFKDVITSSNKPYGLHRARDERFFVGEKIIALRKCPNRPSFSYVDFTSYFSATFYIIKSDRINLKYLTGILNSNLIKFWLKNKGKMQGDNYQLDKEPLLNIPICVTDEKTQKEVIERVEKIISKISEFQQKQQKISEMMRHELGLDKISKKLENFYTLSFDNFILLSKKDISIDRKQELMEYFNKSKHDILKLRDDIRRIDDEIDNLVYKIYGLDEKDINLILNSFN